MKSRSSLTPQPPRLPPLSTHRSLHRALKSPIPRGDLSPYLRPQGPYITFEMLKKEEEKEGKRRWVTRRGFSTAVKCEPHYIPNYVQATTGENPSTHQFRQCYKSRWLAGDFKPAKYTSQHSTKPSFIADLSFR